jgi:hypothetical protein
LRRPVPCSGSGRRLYWEGYCRTWWEKRGRGTRGREKEKPEGDT